MTVILCTGPRGEILFHQRRVSRDRVVTEELMRIAEQRNLWVTPYSAKLLAGGADLYVSEDPLAKAEKGDVCFLEDAFGTLFQHIGEIEELMIYRWDKMYPLDQTFSTTRFLEEAAKAGSTLALTETTEFSGYTHELITKEVYRICDI